MEKNTRPQTDGTPMAGASKTLRYNRLAICTDCNGIGSTEFNSTSILPTDPERIECPTCQGDGRVMVITNVNIVPFKKTDKILLR